MNNIAGVILAAGKGKRLNSTTLNKVMLPLGGKPMIAYTVKTLKKTGFETIIIVIGHAKESIIDYFQDTVIYAEQEQALGTAQAAGCALNVLPDNVSSVFIVYGDDSYVYPPELVAKLINNHRDKKADLTLLTIELSNPDGIGRIIRDKQGQIISVVEEKDASDEQKKITEVNAGCYVIQKEFLKKFLPLVPKNSITEEYYLTDLVKLAVDHHRTVEAVRGGRITWRGVNTPEQLIEAQKIIKSGQQTQL